MACARLRRGRQPPTESVWAAGRAKLYAKEGKMTRDIGLPVILWVKGRKPKEEEAWKVLPESIAKLALDDFAQSGALARAAIYRKPPAHAPFGVVRKWAAQFFKVDDETDH